jgi:hypothetical protein
MVYGVDVDGTHVSFLRYVKLAYKRRLLRSEPFAFNLRGDLDPEVQSKLELEFMGHYGEPNLEIIYNHNDGGAQTLYLLEYNPQTGEWKTTKQDGEGATVLDSPRINERLAVLDSPVARFVVAQLEV